MEENGMQILELYYFFFGPGDMIQRYFGFRLVGPCMLEAGHPGP